MNNKQKQLAIAALTKWWAADSNKAVLSTGYEMAGVLQELIDAPEPEQPNQSEQHLEMVNAPAPSVPDGLIQNLVQTAMRGLLTDDDMANLRRFDECCQDSDADGHAVAKPKMKRLELAGVVRSCGFGRHETTAFGDWLLADAPEAPALTDERILEIHREVLRGDAGGNRLQTVILMARAIEREILGGNK